PGAGVLSLPDAPASHARPCAWQPASLPAERHPQCRSSGGFAPCRLVRWSCSTWPVVLPDVVPRASLCHFLRMCCITESLCDRFSLAPVRVLGSSLPRRAGLAGKIALGIIFPGLRRFAR